MDKFDDSYFSESTGLPSSSDPQSQAIAPTATEGPENLEDYDFTAYLNDALDQGEPSAPVEDYETLMNMNFNQIINYEDDYNGELGGPYVNPAVTFPYTGPGEQQAAPIMTAVNPFFIGLLQAAPIVTSIDPLLIGPQQEQDGRYRNDILNSFISPVVPLRVIDGVKYPFDQELQVALEMELEREKDRQTAEVLLNGMGQSAPAPKQTSRPAAPMKKTGNKRPDNIRNFSAADFYEPLQSRPDSWGSINPETGDQLFQYTEHGELNPLHSFTVEQISEYIGSHPLHFANDVHNPKDSDLILWIQTVPADSGRRYPDKQSDKCRFADCPDPHRTIRKGEFRVALDEQYRRQQNTDPFHCAGYVHLYCLEKFFDFPQISKDFNVKPDTRVFPEGKNKMAITRDHLSMEGIVLEFIAGSVPWALFGNEPRPIDYYEFTLCSRLTAEHLEQQPKHLQKIREERGGNSIDIHKNNLDLCVANAKLLKQNRALQKVAPKPKQPTKRKANALDDQENNPAILEGQILERTVENAGSSSSPAPAKRRRSPRISRSSETINWTNDFHNPALPF